jgi:hypothetical protein
LIAAQGVPRTRGLRTLVDERDDLVVALPKRASQPLGGEGRLVAAVGALAPGGAVSGDVLQASASAAANPNTKTRVSNPNFDILARRRR